jgi:hypothetical protein
MFRLRECHCASALARLRQWNCRNAHGWLGTIRLRAVRACHTGWQRWRRAVSFHVRQSALSRVAIMTNCPSPPRRFSEPRPRRRRLPLSQTDRLAPGNATASPRARHSDVVDGPPWCRSLRGSSERLPLSPNARRPAVSCTHSAGRAVGTCWRRSREKFVQQLLKGIFSRPPGRCRSIEIDW